MQITNLPTHNIKNVPIQIVSGYSSKIGVLIVQDLNKILAELEYEAIKNMINNAQRLNADAIINYKITFVTGNSAMTAIVNGTAIKYI